jgi:hypothetical protein
MATSVQPRRFQVGDIVRFKSQTYIDANGLRFNVAADEVGKIFDVEARARTAPTYQIAVEFPRYRVPFVFESYYELVNPETASE